MGARGRWWATFVVAFALGASWALTVPPSGGPDEQAHLLKAVGVARGDLSTSITWVESGLGSSPETKVDTVAGYAGGVLYEQLACWSGVPDQPTSCAPPLPDTMGEEMKSATYVGAYQPFYYAAVGWPTRVLPPSTGVYAARFMSVALNAALAASALASARQLGRMTLIGTVLAITPAVAFMAATVNPQGPEILAATALWSTGLLLLRNPDVGRRVVIRLGLAAVVLASARPTGTALTAMLLATLVVAAAEPTSLRQAWRRRSVRATAALVAAASVANLGHVLATDALNSVIRTPLPAGSKPAHRLALEAAPDLLRDQVGLLSWHGRFTLDLAVPLVIAWSAPAVALIGTALVMGPWRSRLTLLALVAGWVSMPVVAALLEPEVGWQGRYGLPLGVGLTILAGSILDARRMPSGRIHSWTLVSTALLSGVALLVANQQIMSRNLHGQPSSIFSGRSTELWNGPSTPTVLLVAATLASAAWATLLVTKGSDGRLVDAPDGAVSPAGSDL